MLNKPVEIRDVFNYLFYRKHIGSKDQTESCDWNLRQHSPNAHCLLMGQDKRRPKFARSASIKYIISFFFVPWNDVCVSDRATAHRGAAPFFFVDLVSKADSVHDGQLQVDVALLQLVHLWPELHLVLIVAGLFVFKGRIEQCIHQSWLPNPGFTLKHKRDDEVRPNSH